jgi:hypothetical protein
MNSVAVASRLITAQWMSIQKMAFAALLVSSHQAE